MSDFVNRHLLRRDGPMAHSLIGVNAVIRKDSHLGIIGLGLVLELH
jgi:hypothetical protein